MITQTSSKSYWKKLLAPWVLVVTGILFNILSAVITHYFIGLNNSRLSQLEEQTQRINSQINNNWQQRQNIERKMEFILLLQQQGKLTEDPFVLKHIEQFVHDLHGQYKITPATPLPLDSQKIIQLVQKTQTQLVNNIDAIYFNQLTLDKEKNIISDNNSRLMSTALFLQLIGLILVLAKDFYRNN